MYFYYLEIRPGTTRVAARKQNKLAIKEMLFAGIQAAGGTALAFYTYENSASLIWPSLYSAIALGGTFNVLRSMRKILRGSASNERDESCPVNNVATGTFIYFGSLYAFSEAWRSNHMLWMPCLGSAALGLYYAASSTYSEKMKPLLKCCQLSFEPALIVGGATYLLCFRNHEEDWVYWFPMVATGLNGFKIAVRGIYTNVFFPISSNEDGKPCPRGEDEDGNIFIPGAIEMLIGGCVLTASSISLAIYLSIKEIYLCWRPYTLATGSFGVYIITAGVSFIQMTLGVDDEAAICISGMLAAPIIVFLAGLFVQWTEHKRVALALFPFLAVCAYSLLWRSVCDLYELVPRPVFIKYCLRAWGPMLIASSSAVSAYVCYRYGWRSSMLMTPFVSSGIYITYKGLSRIDES